VFPQLILQSLWAGTALTLHNYNVSIHDSDTSLIRYIANIIQIRLDSTRLAVHVHCDDIDVCPLDFEYNMLKSDPNRFCSSRWEKNPRRWHTGDWKTIRKYVDNNNLSCDPMLRSGMVGQRRILTRTRKRQRGGEESAEAKIWWNLVLWPFIKSNWGQSRWRYAVYLTTRSSTVGERNICRNKVEHPLEDHKNPGRDIIWKSHTEDSPKKQLTADRDCPKLFESPASVFEWAIFWVPGFAYPGQRNLMGLLKSSVWALFDYPKEIRIYLQRNARDHCFCGTRDCQSPEISLGRIRLLLWEQYNL
jgi:hypothetical protein